MKRHHPSARILTLIFFFFFSSLIPSFAQQAKYVFYFIGDGMGIPHVAAAQAYLKTTGDSQGTEEVVFTKFPVTGLCTTHAENRLITGSAAAGTALATGHKTTIGTIGMAADKKQPLESIAERVKKEGFKVGIISSVSIDHATPAAFYAHQPERSMYYEIALDLPRSGFDFFGGGGLKDPLGIDNQVSARDRIEESGYLITETKQDFYNLKKGVGKVFAMGSIIEPSGALRYAIDQTGEDIPLESFVSKAIEVLDNDHGFFILCEEGKIDWAAHENDGATMIENVISLSKSVDAALDFYHQHPDETLIIVTSDHETGGFALGSAPTRYKSNPALLRHQEFSAQTFYAIADSLFAEPQNQNLGYAMQLVEDHFGLGGNSGLQLTPYEKKMLEDAYFVSAGKITKDHEEEYEMYGGYHPMAVTATKILNNRAGMSFTTWSHTATPVPVFAIGAGAALFDGFYDNTDIPKKIAQAMKIDFNK
jgi:alkaline phosphatase